MPDLFTQVHAASIPLTSKADIVEYYKAEHPRNWQASLVHDLHPFTHVKSEHNLARRFSSGEKGGENRLARPGSKKEQEEYRALGETLPRKAPEGGYHIYGTVWIKYSPGECEEREVDEYITGKEAQALAKMASADMAQAVINHYNTDPFGDESHATIGDCNPPDLYVEPIEEE